MFCPKCGSLLYPEGDELVCRKCGYRKKKNEGHVVVTKAEEKETLVVEEDIELLPKTKVKCPKCGNDEAYWILRQTRAADEPETRIYICTKCGHRWREY